MAPSDFLEITAVHSGWVKQRPVVVAQITNNSGVPITILSANGAPALPGPTALSTFDEDRWITKWPDQTELQSLRRLHLPASSSLVIGTQASAESVLKFGIVYQNTILPTTTDTTWSEPVDFRQIPTFGRVIDVGEIQLRDHLQDYRSGPTYLAYDSVDQRYEWRVTAGDSTWSFSSTDGELIDVVYNKTIRHIGCSPGR